jgi:tetratricopeptide (TPR) repeat protein
MRSLPRRLVRTAAALGLATAATLAAAQANGCGPLTNAFGPFDYRKVRGEQLQLVEGAHFTPPVESLIHGATATHPGQDIDYTLRAFPNHHRALLAVSRLAERDKTTRPQGMNYSVDCYFERALRFKPDDLVARMLFVGYLTRGNRIDEAKQQLAYVAANAGDNPFTYYNVGLLYLDMKDYDDALSNAHKAYAMGFNRPELRDRLQAVGKWTEPPPAPADAASAPAAAAASAPLPATAASAAQ